MAKVTVVAVSDDIDGTEPARKVSFGLDGKDYEIDLSEANETALREALEKYLSYATPVASKAAKRTISRPASAGRHDGYAVRKWAKEKGYNVPARGRLSEQWFKLYDESNAS